MKNKILELGKKCNTKLKVNVIKTGFDSYQYELYNGKNFIGVYEYFTGTTSTGVSYPTKNILIDIKKDLKHHKLC